MIHINFLAKGVDKMWITYFIPVFIFVGLIGMIWCLFGMAWINRIRRRYTEQIDKPWTTLIEKYKSREITVEEFNKGCSFFLKIGTLSLMEYGKFSPFYFIKHWNDQYDEGWLEERKYREVTNEKT